ncbi:hypothetical protein EDB81DRAFT_781151 [Dactylonectria macrodidyma]|uniref:Uncharacterized protein n=1 Tax=Dactylonectria macrodidyma TaxID=307937 RepID=A0A9P9FMU1_9HYPO|nr:hypothetical protein EDB81DRAFT_781151 [Dactylonectria macrodidyma]
MSVLGSFRRWLSLKQYQLEVTFSVYMFTPWEKFFFSSLVFLLFSLTFIAACLYLPHHISFLVGRAWYYINGEHIDVAEAAREVVRDISAGALSGTGIMVGTATAAVQETVETVLKEL